VISVSARACQAKDPRGRGRLSIFLGAVAGAGKTTAMLIAARSRQTEGTEVLVGWVETRARPAVQALLEGMKRLSPTPENGFDLLDALARRPTLVVVDELARPNPPGSRHAHRWQDVADLLDAGCDVYTTLNIQDLESLSDVAARITGVPVAETVPDRVFETAAEVHFVDAAPEELRRRLQQGKIGAPAAGMDAEQFFRPGNLLALRELALRRLLDRVDAQLREYKEDRAIRTAWPVTDRILACISPSPNSIQVVRAAKRLADRLQAEWLVLFVETRSARLSAADRSRLAETLRTAERLGAQVLTLVGDRIGEEILTHARARHVTKLVVGKSGLRRWQRILTRSLVDTLVQESGDIDVYLTKGEEAAHLPFVAPRRRRRPAWLAYARGVVPVALCTAMSWALFPYLDASTLTMVYLLGVVGVAATSGPGPASCAAVLSVAAFDFFFVPPYYSLAVANTQSLVTFAVMLVVALMISQLTVRIRWQAEAARQRERRTAAQYALSRELAGTRGVPNILRAAIRHMADVFRSRIVVYLPDASGRLALREDLPSRFESDGSSAAICQWTFEHAQMAGLGTSTFPGSTAVYLPLLASRGTLGVLGVRPDDPHTLDALEHLHQLETFANQTALAVERAQLAEETRQAEIRAEAERMRNSLLSSVSHDLRTPLASITGAASTLLESRPPLDPAAGRELLEMIQEESDRLGRLLNNLLQMTRLESGALQLRQDHYPLEEIVGTALGRLAKLLGNRPVVTQCPADLPLVNVDDTLIEQVLINLVENAVKYTPADRPIEIAAAASAGTVTVEVADRGPGLPPDAAERVFEKFYRGGRGAGPGAGLGLAICRGFVEAHGGRIWAENRPEGGAVFRFTLPAGQGSRP
jgi:two-component system, OmpR family, sensor histidine kinase KdpD